MIRTEHIKGLRGYTLVHFHLMESEQPMPENISELLTKAYKDLSDSLFNEMNEHGRTISLTAAEDALNILVADVVAYLNRPEKELTQEKIDLAGDSFGGLSELLMLVTDFEKMPEIK